VCKVVDSNGNGWGGGRLLHLFYIPKKPVRDRGMDLKILRVYNISNVLYLFFPVNCLLVFKVRLFAKIYEIAFS
jgi:hypothetical protein